MGPREQRGPVAGTRFMVGKYEVVGKPIPGSAHMLRYTISVQGVKIGSMVSVPTESDCHYLENPPPVLPLKPYQATYRPGRPKKGTTPQAPVASEARRDIAPEDVSIGVSLPRLGVEDR